MKEMYHLIKGNHLKLPQQIWHKTIVILNQNSVKSWLKTASVQDSFGSRIVRLWRIEGVNILQLLSNEATFCLNRFVNRHNLVNKHKIHPTPNRLFKNICQLFQSQRNHFQRNIQTNWIIEKYLIYTLPQRYFPVGSRNDNDVLVTY